MKNHTLWAVLLFTQMVRAQPALKTYPLAQIPCLTYTSGAYSGEVNRLGRPDGYGLYRFADGNAYVGQFTDGQVRGQGFLLESNPPVVTVAQWEKGQKVGQWFRLRQKELKLLEGTAVQRSCRFAGNVLAAVALSSNDPVDATLAAFMVMTNQRANASVLYCPTLSAELNMDKLMLDFTEEGDRVRVRPIKNGDLLTDAANQSFSAVDGETPAKLQALLGKTLPPWLSGADHRFRDDNKQKFFANVQQVANQQGSYGMLYGSDGQQTAFVRVARLDQHFQPLGFYQEIFHNGNESYRYTMGDIGPTNGLRGNGVVARVSAASDDFELSAGDIRQQDKAAQILHSGMEVAYSKGAFFVAIGDWDNENLLGRGFIIAPESKFFYRGEIRQNAALGSGASIGPDGTTIGLRYGEQSEPSLIPVPDFPALQPMSLFLKRFDTLLQ